MELAIDLFDKNNCLHNYSMHNHFRDYLHNRLVGGVAMAYVWMVTEARERCRTNVAPDPDRGCARAYSP